MHSRHFLYEQSSPKLIMTRTPRVVKESGKSSVKATGTVMMLMTNAAGEMNQSSFTDLMNALKEIGALFRPSHPLRNAPARFAGMALVKRPDSRSPERLERHPRALVPSTLSRHGSDHMRTDDGLTAKRIRNLMSKSIVLYTDTHMCICIYVLGRKRLRISSTFMTLLMA